MMKTKFSEKVCESTDHPAKKRRGNQGSVKINFIYGGILHSDKVLVSSSHGKTSCSKPVGERSAPVPVTGRDISLLFIENVRHPPLNIAYDPSKHKIYLRTAEQVFLPGQKMPYYYVYGGHGAVCCAR